jgi:hypothetical protein
MCSEERMSRPVRQGESRPPPAPSAFPSQLVAAKTRAFQEVSRLEAHASREGSPAVLSSAGRAAKSDRNRRHGQGLGSDGRCAGVVSLAAGRGWEGVVSWQQLQQDEAGGGTSGSTAGRGAGANGARVQQHSQGPGSVVSIREIDNPMRYIRLATPCRLPNSGDPNYSIIISGTRKNQVGKGRRRLSSR